MADVLINFPLGVTLSDAEAAKNNLTASLLAGFNSSYLTSIGASSVVSSIPSPAPPPISNSGQGSSSSTTAVIVGTVVGVVGLAVILASILVLRRMKLKREKGKTSLEGSSRPLSDFHKSWLVTESDITFGSVLGSGSYGEVRRGKWRGTDVAIKTFLAQADESALQEFESEVTMLAALRHPNILQFLGLFIHPKLSIVTELMPRGSLFQILHR